MGDLKKMNEIAERKIAESEKKKLKLAEKPPSKKEMFGCGIFLLIVVIAAFAIFQNVDTEKRTASPAENPPVEEKIAPAPVQNNPHHYKGRGLDGRDEPQYTGVKGYVAVHYSELDDLLKDLNYTNTPWQVPTYEKDKQFWNKTERTIAHKTPVIVREQFLKHEGFNDYSGYLRVENLEDGQNYFIDVRNFVTEPYWENQNPIDALKGGFIIVTFHQKSDYYPVTAENKKVEVPDGLNLLAVGKTGTYPKGMVDSSTHPVRVQLTVAGHTIFFNRDDLTINY